MNSIRTEWFRFIHLVIFTLAIVDFFIAYYRVPILFSAYGHDFHLVGSANFETFTAYRQIEPMSNVILWSSTAIAFLSLLMSVVAISLRQFARSYLPLLIGIVSLILLLIYGFARMMPSRVA